MSGILLDRYGHPERYELLGPSGLPVRIEANLASGWNMPNLTPEQNELHEQISPDFNRLPQSTLDLLEKSKKADFSKASPFMNSAQGWRQVEGVIVADTAITGSSEAIAIPDFLLAIPRPGQTMVGVSYKVTLVGEQSAAVSTPGTMTHRLRYGGVAGVLLAASSAIAPTGTQVITTTSIITEYWVTVRTQPTLTTATAWCQGRVDWPGVFETTPASTTIMVTQLKAMMIPASGPAVSASLDVSVAKALSPTYQSSVTTANYTTHVGVIESLN